MTRPAGSPGAAQGAGPVLPHQADPARAVAPPKTPLPDPLPVPVERLAGSLARARSALVTRQAQLAACRTCGTEAAAYDEAAADLSLLLAWVQRQAIP